MKVYQIPAGLDNYRSLRDGTIKMTFETQELTPEQMANIHWSLNKAGFLAFSPDPFATQELEEIDKIKVDFDDGGKPPSQRLRAVLFRLWQQTPEGYKASNDHYLAHMEKIINHYKNKLDQ
jgi:hypothetical protein